MQLGEDIEGECPMQVAKETEQDDRKIASCTQCEAVEELLQDPANVGTYYCAACW
eukprot:CAMPEP_0194529384 /NCGR_PEP_ID=MMETSP0253-20130528/66051_1 /TAXON_ID=2966 /ORGANISM="Noctiluca scintillans" /LENGTH=54 /DNA_ID=CAMNT_0039374521 /DNA_START=1 /DNA_END=162 /DNA_ORIENTATION=+